MRSQFLAIPFTILISVLCFNPINLFARAKLQKVYPFRSSETFVLAIKITTMQLNMDKKIYRTNTKEKINILKNVERN